MNINDTLNTHPNFTILAPGICNAACQFCFWNHQDGKIKPDADYFHNLRHVLMNLPRQYRTISVSGGEPSLSPYLKRIMEIIVGIRYNIRRYDRVVLTSNGARPGVLVQACKRRAGIDFLNVSRHHYDDVLNDKIFNTGPLRVPRTAELKELIASVDVPVTLNCVISNHTNQDFILEYIAFARRVGAHSVSFRKEASDITPTPVERLFTEMFGPGKSNDCPVCRGHTQVFNGMEVRWKGSYTEPSIQVGKTYEGVFHADGKLYADWARKFPLDVPTLPGAAGRAGGSFVGEDMGFSMPASPRDEHVHAGCGSAGCGGTVNRAGCGSAGCGGVSAGCG